MTSIEHTAYPRLKRTLTPKELDQIYTPTPAELLLARRTAKRTVATLGFLVHLKVFQRLGYVVASGEIPTSIVDHIATCAKISLSPRDLVGYDDSGTRRRHLPLIREALSIQPYGPPARKAFVSAMVEAARTKDDLADLINVPLEELVRCRFELPAFGTLDRAAHDARAVVARGIYRQVEHRLSWERPYSCLARDRRELIFSLKRLGYKCFSNHARMCRRRSRRSLGWPFRESPWL